MWRRAGLLLRLGLVLVVFAASATAKAWGVVGHRIIGELAEGRLSPATRLAVHQLLAGEPEPTLAGVAAWADTVRTRGTAPFHYVEGDTDIADPAALSRIGACRAAPGAQPTPAIASSEADVRRPDGLSSHPARSRFGRLAG